MSGLPIKGAGLKAITTNTIKEPPPEGSEVQREQIDALRKDIERLSAAYDAKIRGLEKEVGEYEKKYASCHEELENLRKTIAREMPVGEEAKLVIAGLKEKAEQFDRNQNLLDAFYLYRRIIRLDPENIDAFYEVAAIYYSVDLFDKAAECLRAILEIDPSQSRAAESLEEIENEYQ